MSKSKTKGGRNKSSNTHYEDRVMRVLANLQHKDLQRECILRGMPFEDVHKSHFVLVSWFYKNFDNGQDENKLILFDKYLDDILEKRGYKVGDAMRSPSLRLGYYGDNPEKAFDKPVDLKPNKVPKADKKPKSVVDEKTGVRAGTKKSLTFQLTIQGLEFEEIKKQVLAAFPDAQEKSIKIWMKKAIKTQKSK